MKRPLTSTLMPLLLECATRHAASAWTTPTLPSSRVVKSPLLAAPCCDVKAPPIVATDALNYQTFLIRSEDSEPNPFDSLIPFLPNSKGCDVTVVWDDHPHEAVDEMLSRIVAATTTMDASQRKQLHSNLLKSFTTFESLIYDMPLSQKKKARLVATRGRVGTKCPRWHADHVPLRWIQSWAGPGCDYVVGESGVSRTLLNNVEDTCGIDELTTDEANAKLVDSDKADVRQGRPGEAVVLVGRDNDKGIPAAVHKSPTLLPWQGRVLLTLDVVRD